MLFLDMWGRGGVVEGGKRYYLDFLLPSLVFTAQVHCTLRDIVSLINKVKHQHTNTEHSKFILLLHGTCRRNIRLRCSMLQNVANPGKGNIVVIHTDNKDALNLDEMTASSKKY